VLPGNEVGNFVCSSANLEHARRLGCSRVFDYHGESWDRAIKANGSVRINGLLDIVGGRDIEGAGRRVLGRDGT
jgi:NADPH:quinone reductase-like Zn-dependent oxidoreductase